MIGPSTLKTNNKLKIKMKQSIFKPIAGGILLGAFVFFTGPLLPIVLLLKFIFTPFGMGRIGGRGRMYASRLSFAGMHDGPGLGVSRLSFADKIRSMNDEDYTAFKTKYQDRFKNGCGED